MPAKSQAQYRKMQAAAHGKVPGIPVSVGKEFVAATKKPSALPQRVRADNHWKAGATRRGR